MQAVMYLGPACFNSSIEEILSAINHNKGMYLYYIKHTTGTLAHEYKMDQGQSIIHKNILHQFLKGKTEPIQLNYTNYSIFD